MYYVLLVVCIISFIGHYIVSLAIPMTIGVIIILINIPQVIALFASDKFVPNKPIPKYCF